MEVAAKSNTAVIASHRRLEFGDFVLDLDRGSLTRDGVDVLLRPKSFAVLRYLVSHPGVLISKDELLAAVWNEVVVTEDSLNQCLNQIRRALGDHRRTMVRTVRGRGYLFDLPVAELAAGMQSTQSLRRPRAWLAAGLAATLAVGSLLLAWQLQPDTGSGGMMGGEALPPLSIAVLPFDDMSPAGDQAYFADGVSEEVLSLLAQSPQLRVASRTSSFSFRQNNSDIASIAEALQVTYVLEGSVRKAGDRLRITAHLVSGSSQSRVWSQSFERTLGDAYVVQSEIAGSLAQQLKLRLLGEEGTVASTEASREAREQYSQAMFFFGRRGPGDNTRAVQHLQQALALDPGLADAWVGLAGALRLQVLDGSLSWGEGNARQLEALVRALDLEPNHAEAHIRLADFYYWIEGRTERAKAHYQQARLWGQNSALVLSVFAGRACFEGRYEEAVALQRRATALDPVGFVHRANLASYLYQAGDLHQARRELLKALALNPEMRNSINEQLAHILIWQHQYQQAETLFQQLPAGTVRDQGLAMTHQGQGRVAVADMAVARLAAVDGAEAAAHLANVFAMRGDQDASFRWLQVASERVFESYQLGASWLQLRDIFCSPFLRSLHRDPRWQAWRSRAEERVEQSRGGFELVAQRAQYPPLT